MREARHNLQENNSFLPLIHEKWEKWPNSEQLKVEQVEAFLKGLQEVLESDKVAKNTKGFLHANLENSKAKKNKKSLEDVSKIAQAHNLVTPIILETDISPFENNKKNYAKNFLKKFKMRVASNIISTQLGQLPEIQKNVQEICLATAVPYPNLELLFKRSEADIENSGKLGFNPIDYIQYIDKILEKIKAIKNPEKKDRIKPKGT